MTRPAEEWEPAGGLVLEPNALRTAKETARSVALTAGPGAGKTEVLAQRCDFLLQTNFCPYPRRILAISFKVDASANLAERVDTRCGATLSNRLHSRTFHGFATRIIRRYRVALTGPDVLEPGFTVGAKTRTRTQITYDDMIPLATKILNTNIYARNAVRHTYSHVLLDEFQDCNSDQYELIKLAFGKSDAILTAVGDTKQRIMGFAGALEGIFTTFADDFDAKPLNLYQNHRSAPRIRRVHNAMVKVMDPQAAVPDSETEGDEGTVEYRSYESSSREAEGIASLIESRILEDGIEPAEIAVLVSKQASAYLEDFLTIMDGRGLRVRNEQSQQNLVLEPIFRLVADFVAVTVGYRSPAAYTRLLDQLAGFGDTEEEERERTRWLARLAAARKRLRADELEHTSIAVDEVSKFLNQLRPEFVRSMSFDYESENFLQEIVGKTLDNVKSAYSRALTDSEALRFLDDRDAVRVLTVHKSKGLEFDTVVFCAVEEETFFDGPADDRCAYFVGVSRAKERLVVTTAAERPRPAGVKRWDRNRSPHAEFLDYLSAAD